VKTRILEIAEGSGRVATPEDGHHATGANHTIDTIEGLRTHLQWAIELEHATIPPYLCALYSLDPHRNAAAAQVIGSVMAEEMLHLALAANLLNAVGGSPKLDSPELLPPYPHPLPHGDRSIALNIGPFAPDSLDLFLRVEKPAEPDAPPEDQNYRTIGQFYSAIESSLRSVCASLGEDNVFTGAHDRQIADAHLRTGGGHMVVVADLESALAALHEIVEQGEGAARVDVWDGDPEVDDPGRNEVAHYYRFRELQQGRKYRDGDTPQSGPTGEPILVDFDAVLPMRPNPCSGDYPVDSPIRVAQDKFNITYCELLRMLEEAFNGEPGKLNDAIGVMFGLKAQAKNLMETPNEDGLTTAGPTFEYVPPDRRS